MNWIDVAKLIAPLAPTLGSVLGGFIPVPGAAIAGQALGNVIARSLGVAPTPEAVAAAVGSTPNDVLIERLRAATEEAKAQWPAYAEVEKAQLHLAEVATAEVNATMRLELEHQHWFFTGWRPTAGWLFNVFAAVYGALLALAVILYGSGSPSMLAAIKEVQYIAIAHLGALAAIVGVFIIGRSTEKTALIQRAPVEVVVPKPVKR